MVISIEIRVFDKKGKTLYKKDFQAGNFTIPTPGMRIIVPGQENRKPALIKNVTCLPEWSVNSPIEDKRFLIDCLEDTE